MLRAIYSEEPTIPAKNTTFQKLFLLSLEAIKLVCLTAEFCSQ